MKTKRLMIVIKKNEDPGPKAVSHGRLNESAAGRVLEPVQDGYDNG